MYGIISSRDFEELEGQYGAPSFHAREGDLYQALAQAARTQLHFLLIDIDCSGTIVEELHQYRVQRPDTHIIILAPGRDPGDSLVARVVSLGVYDIINEPEETMIKTLLYSIKNPANYTQAARWLQLGQPSGKPQSDKNGSEAIKEVLVQQRPLGLTTIAVAGAGPGTGVSHLCLAAATNLARFNNNRVVLAEWPLGDKTGTDSQYAYLSFMGAKYDSRKVDGIDMNTARFNSFDIFLNARSFRSLENIFPFIVHKSYDYLVLDLGELSPEKITEMNRAALTILVVNAAPYRIERFLPIIDEEDMSLYTPNLSRWNIALNLAGDTEEKWFLNVFNKHVGKVYSIPHMSSLLECQELFNNILRPVLPTVLPRKKRPFWKLK